MRPPQFTRRPSFGSNRSLLGRRVPKSKFSQSAAKYEATEPPVFPDYVAPSSVSTLSGSSEDGQEMALDWASAARVSEQPVESIVSPKRRRSFTQSLFRRRSRSRSRSRSRTRSLRDDKRIDFNFIEAPIQPPTPTKLPYDATDFSQGVSEASSHEDTKNRTWNVHSRTVKKLAPPKPVANTVSDEESSIKMNDETCVSVDDDAAVTCSAVESDDDDEKSGYSIPMSYFLKHNPVSWGLSSKDPETASDNWSEDVIQERHWGKEVRSRSSTSWIPTEDERYKIAQAFIYGEDDANYEDDSVDTGASSATGTTGTAVTENTDFTQDTEDANASEVSEETNDTTSAFTGHTSDYSSATSLYTSRSAETGETTLFGDLGVDEDSIVPPPTRRVGPRKRKLLKPKHNILVEVFSDLRLIAEDMADGERGCEGCFVNPCTGRHL